MKISALILTFNEESTLRTCLDSLSSCDDIVVLDSGSTDSTLDIARSMGARLLHRRFDTFAEQRNFGLEHGQFVHDWVLHLDADEVVTPDFRDAIESLRPIDGIDAYRVPSKLMLFGHWLRYAGMYPTYQVRLGHRDRLRFVQVGHGQREAIPATRIGLFHEPYLHYSFAHGMRKWLEKHIRYAQDEAHLMRSIAAGTYVEEYLPFGDATQKRRALKALTAKIPLILRAPVRFIYVYFFRAGFLDGSAGLVYALMLAVYEGMVAIFEYECRLAEPET